MKTIKLYREGCCGDPDYTRYAKKENILHHFDWEDGNGQYFLCQEELNKILKIRKNAESLWLTVRKAPKKDFYKARLESNEDTGNVGVSFDNEIYEIFYSFYRFLRREGIDCDQDFYFKIEYK